MRFSKILTFTALLLLFVGYTFSAEAISTPNHTAKSIVVRLHLSSDEKIQKDLAYYLKGELELIEGVTVTESKDLPADYELDVQEVDEPLGRMAFSASFVRPFNQKDNAASFRKLMADHWKGGMKDEEWVAFSDYFKPYGITVSRQILTGRKSKVRELCTSVAATFSKDVLKRPVSEITTPEGK
jgi:hypothetical protein